MTPGVILAAARGLVEREGLGGLTMPGLARELDCGVMSLYSHFQSKDELLAALANAAMRDLLRQLPPAGGGPWDSELVAYFSAFRDLLESSPVYREIQVHAPALVVGPALTPAQLRRLDTGVGVLLRAGLNLADAAAVYNVCLNYTRSFVGHKYGVLAGPGSTGRPGEPWRPAETDDYPVLRQIPDVGQLLRVDDATFGLGLELLVDGIAGRYGLSRTTELPPASCPVPFPSGARPSYSTIINPYWSMGSTREVMVVQLANSVALVTGGAGGLGEAAVRRLVAAGSSVVIADLADDRAEKLAADLGEKAVYARTDVTDEASVAAAVARAQDLGTFRHAVIAHGGFGVAERIVKRDGAPADLAGFTKTIDLYLTGTYNVLRIAAAAIAKTEPDADGQRGAVVATSSIAAYEGQIGQSAYAAAKAGVVGLTLVAARDLGQLGIRVVTIAPGTMLTPIMESVGEEALAKFAANVPNPKRLGKPAEYAALVTHVLENSYLNGETIRLDGAQRFAQK